MPYRRVWLAITVVFTLTFPAVVAFGGHSALGVLTLATHAHLDQATAFPGLSVFEGERLSTEAGGHLSVQVGHSTLSLPGKTELVLIPITGGVHVDMDGGSVHFSTADKEVVEVHALDAITRPASPRSTQASVTILGANVLQVAAEYGTLSFNYREEDRLLPAGQIYCIYLDDSDGTGGASVNGTRKPGSASKVSYFLVGAGMGGVAWGIQDALRPRHEPISPAKP